MAEIWFGADVRPRHVHGRRLPLRRVAAGRVPIRRRADLVGPVDGGPFALGPTLDGRVDLLQPVPHLLGVLVAGVAARPLGREAPATQVEADRPHRQFHGALPADQVGDGAATPQRGGDAQFLGLVGAQQELDVFGLGFGQGAARADGATAAFMGQGVEAAADVGGPPVADGLAADAQEVGDVGFREAAFTGMQGAKAEGFEDFIRKFPGIRQRDGHETFLRRAKGKAHHGISGQLLCRGNSICSSVKRGRSLRFLTLRRRASIRANEEPIGRPLRPFCSAASMFCQVSSGLP